jgi:hypothetical protein
LRSTKNDAIAPINDVGGLGGRYLNRTKRPLVVSEFTYNRFLHNNSQYDIITGVFEGFSIIILLPPCPGDANS